MYDESDLFVDLYTRMYSILSPDVIPDVITFEKTLIGDLLY